MKNEQISQSENLNHHWVIVRLLPDLRHYTVARFFNRQDAQDHKRVLDRFLPDAKFEIIFDPPKSEDIQ